MKYHSVPTSKFAKDYERLKKRGKEIKKLASVIDALLAGEKLATKYRDHALTGDCPGAGNVILNQTGCSCMKFKVRT